MYQHLLDRRSFLTATGSAAAATLLPRPLLAKDEAGKPNFAWHDVTEWGVEGKGWEDTDRFFDRLPAKAEKLVRGAVWNLSRHSAGMLCRFATDATTIHTRYELLSGSVAMPHMPATGVSGVDLYVRDSEGQSRWVGVTRPTGKKVEAALAKNMDKAADGMREFSLYLPLYNSIESLEIGVPEGATFKPLAPREAKPLVFYGTSIMHGACATWHVDHGYCGPAV